jgi:hypothetical protein
MTLYAELLRASVDPTTPGRGEVLIENCHWGLCPYTAMGPAGHLPVAKNYMRGRDNASCPTLDFCPFNTYRISGDIDNSSGVLPDPCHKLPHPCHTAGSWVRNLNNTRPYLDEHRPLSRPGCWQTPDNLQVGRVEAPPPHGAPPAPAPGCSTTPQPCPAHPGATFCEGDPAPDQCSRPMPHKPCPPCPSPPAVEARREVDEKAFLSWNRAHFGAWVITSSPLILGMYPSDAQLAPVLDIIGNAEAIEINQAWAGHPGRLVDEVAMPGREPLNKLQMWSKPVRLAHAAGMRQPNASAASVAVAVFVVNYAAVPKNYTVDLALLPPLAAHGRAVAVRDVWRRKALAVATGSYVVELPPYDSALHLLEGPLAVGLGAL